MKKFLIVFVLTITTFASFSQLKKGHLSYKIQATSDDPQMEMAATLMENSTMDIYFEEGKTRTDLVMGAFMDISTIVNNKTGKVLMLMGGMLGKTAVPSTVKELEKINKEENNGNTKVKLVDGKKKILGYSCKKAIITDEEGTEIIYWYTTEIELDKTGQSSFNSDIPGIPLEFETMKNGLNLSFICVDISKTLGKDAKELFSTQVPEGYTITTYDDLNNGKM